MNRHRTLHAVTITAVTAAVIAGCASPGAVGHQGAAPAATTSRRGSSTAKSTPDRGVSAAGIGRSSAWRIKTGKLSVTSGNGTWTTVAFPARVTASAVASVAGTQSTAIFLATHGSPTGPTLNIYRLPAGSSHWSKLALTANWPNGVSARTQPESISVQADSASLVTATASVSLGSAEAATRLFISTDSGQSFTQATPKPTSDVPFQWWFSAFATSTSGVAVAGPAGNMIYSTPDGGQTWTRSILPTLLSAVYGQPIVTGSTYELPVTSQASNGDEQFGIMQSADGGTTFSATGPGVDLNSPYQSFPASTATLGTVWWAIASGGNSSLFRSSDNGATWGSTSMTGFPVGNAALTLVSGPAPSAPLTATAVAQTTQCVKRQNCVTSTTIVTSNNEGATWTSTQ
jgi:hypothetical protein